MKLHRLELEGFGPFRARQSVDFDAFDADGIFLIAGRTGAGKSSVLDGVCFALYGSAPRYDGVEKRLRSDHCEPGDLTEVMLEFTAAERRYRITRSPEYERPKTRGEGLTTEKARAVLSEWNGDRWVGIASKLSEVGTMITDEIVGLTRDQFLQVILLAQGRFAQFLLAKNDERQALLRTLFGSTVYRDYESLLEDRRRAATQRLQAGTAELSLLLDDAEALAEEHDLTTEPEDVDETASVAVRLERLERAVQRAHYRVEQARHRRASAETARSAADEAHRACVAVRDAQLSRAQLRDTLAGLEARAEDVAAQRTRLDRARAAENLRAYLETAETAMAAAVDAEAALATARDAFTAVGGDADAEPDALRTREDAWTGELAVLARAVEREQALPGIEARLVDAEQRHALASSRRADLDAALEAIRERLPALDAESGRLESALERRQDLAAAVEEVTARLDAAHDAERLALAHRAAEEAHATAARHHADATAAVATLLQRRLAGMAGELAGALVDGEACAVCGSLTHPAPAETADEEPVTDAIVAEAQERVATTGEAVTLAADAARHALADLSRAREAAGGRTASELDERRATLLAAVEELDVQVARQTEVTAERTELMARQAATLESVVAADAEIDRARQERTTAQEQLAQARDDVARARGDHASVSARLAELTARRDAARTLMSARDEAQRRRQASMAAESDLATRLQPTAFADRVEAAGAMLPPEEVTALDTSIGAHDRDLAATRELLRVVEIDLAGAPDDPVDVSATQEALRRADAEHTEAIAAEAAAGGASRTLQSRVRRAEAMQASSGALADEHRRITAIADAVAGRNVRKMDLETFVLAAELEQIVGAANRRLDEMSDGRYRLRHTDAVAARGANGLGLEVLDAYTGQARPPQSLSGGESFLASLALALGLAETVTARAGGLRLDTLFVDEGFGSLDAETLETAMRTIDELRQGGRTVGLISHVEAMREQIPAQVRVTARAHGPSTVSQPAPVPA